MNKKWMISVACAASLFALPGSLSPLQAQPQTPEAPKPLPAVPAPPPIDHLLITPVRVEKSDLMELLAVEMWRLRVQVPEPATRLEYRLELRSEGKEAVLLQKGEGQAAKNMEVILRILPEGLSLSSAPTLRINTKLQTLDTDGTNASSNSMLAVTENPLKAFNTMSFSVVPGTVEGNETVLATLHITDKGVESKTQLVLGLSTPKPPEPPK